MPPKFKFTRDEITSAALNLTRKAGYSKKFRSEHEADIIIHQAAKKYFDSLGITKLPSVKSLREEYAGLLEQIVCENKGAY